MLAVVSFSVLVYFTLAFYSQDGKLFNSIVTQGGKSSTKLAISLVTKGAISSCTAHSKDIFLRLFKLYITYITFFTDVKQ